MNHQSSHSTGTRSWEIFCTLTLIIAAGCGAGDATTGLPPEEDEKPGNFSIDIQFVGDAEESYRRTFEASAARWEAIVRGELTDEIVNLPAEECGLPHRAIDTEVDDVLILAQITDIDGPFGSIGGGAPCLIRAQQNGGLPIVGVMILDQADLLDLEELGTLEATITHEMGHILGFGSLWQELGLLANPSLPNKAGADTHFTGTAARTEFEELWGPNYTTGQAVPVENELGERGTRDGHWRENVFTNEMMTGSLDSFASEVPLSRVTIGSMEDLGYEVSYASADEYDFQTASMSRRLALKNTESSRPTFSLLNDVLPITLRTNSP